MNTVLNTTDVIDIRRESKIGTTTRDISHIFGVSPRTIQRIIRGELWATVPTDKSIKNFTNYDITYDGRVWSNSKGGYLALETRAGAPAVRLRKTLKSARRIEKTVPVSTLLAKHF